MLLRTCPGTLAAHAPRPGVPMHPILQCLTVRFKTRSTRQSHQSSTLLVPCLISRSVTWLTPWWRSTKQKFLRCRSNWHRPHNTSKMTWLRGISRKCGRQTGLLLETLIRMMHIPRKACCINDRYLTTWTNKIKSISLAPLLKITTKIYLILLPNWGCNKPCKIN